MAEAGEIFDSVESLLWEREASNREIERLTGLLTYDRLTGLYKTEDEGRQAIISKVEAVFAQGNDLVVATMDLKGFKEVNDRYGHKTGDEVLKTVAGKFKELAGQGGLAMRSHTQGDEFGILFIGKHGEEGVSALQEIQVAGVPWITEKAEGKISFTLGVSRLADLRLDERETSGDVFQHLWQRADLRERDQHRSING